MKQLKFEHHFAKAIKSGLKTATFRVNDDKDIQFGDTIQLVDKVNRDKPTTWEIPGELVITHVSVIPLEDLTKDHMMKAESFTDKNEMLQVFRRFYGEHINLKTKVSVLYFQYNALPEPQKYLNGPTDPIHKIKQAKLFTDGGSRGNPGPSSLGFVVLDLNDKILHTDNKYLGITTNNQAEYHALIAGMEWCLKNGLQELKVFLDSMLVVNQLKGIFKVKNRDLWSLYESASNLAKKFHKISFTHVPRELNKLADREVNKALDAVKGSDIVQ